MGTAFGPGMGCDRFLPKAVWPLLALTAFLATSGVALACTSDDATAKRLQLSARIQSVMMREPTRGQALIRKLQAQMAADRQDARQLDWNNVCAHYDALRRQAQ